MKAFKIPEVEFVYFGDVDIVTGSLCKCVDCTTCPSGQDDCPYFDTCPEYNPAPHAN